MNEYEWYMGINENQCGTIGNIQENLVEKLGMERVNAVELLAERLQYIITHASSKV